MRIHTPDRARRWHRSLGALIALFAVVGIGALGGPVTPASAAGATWAGTGVVLPANVGPGRVSTLQADNCPAPGNCVAVGDYETGTGQSEGLIETQHGGSWTAVELPLPGTPCRTPRRNC